MLLRASSMRQTSFPGEHLRGTIEWESTPCTQNVQKVQIVPPLKSLGKRSYMIEQIKQDAGNSKKMRHMTAIAENERLVRAVTTIQRMFRQKRVHLASRVAKTRAIYQEARARREKLFDSSTNQLSPRSKLRHAFTDIAGATRTVSTADLAVAVLSKLARRRNVFKVMQRQWPKLLLINAAKSHMQDRRSSNSAWETLLK
eukprot:TRINITY_DN6814_c0_g2_i2.p1 TRINITY_DN6814_c0_g2~~TRINITY_DN6814_c0_g2_i2.p1  ORF type:complete len:200 (-),score=28.97 TRINITY_DN6814_c0_g2_i2:49-648(-)